MKNIGIIGAGFISQNAHIPHYIENKNCNVVALAELRHELGKNVCNRWNIPKFYPDHYHLLRDPDIDAVVVIVRRHHTGPVALDCIKAGKDLFTEKPFAQTYARAQSLVNQANDFSIIYSTGFMRRYDSSAVIAKEYLNQFLESGELGDLLYVRSYLSAGGDYCNISGDIKSDEQKPLDPVWETYPSFINDEKGLLFEHFVNVCGHDINLLRFFFPQYISVVSAHLKEGKGAVSVFDIGPCLATFEWMDTLQPTRWDEGIEIMFEKGYIKLSLKPAFLRNQPSALEIYIDKGRDTGSFIQPAPDWSWSFQNEANAFIDALHTRTPTVSSAQECLDDMRLIEDIWKRMIYN